ARLTADHDNLLGALRYAIDTGDADLAIRLVAVLGEYWNLRERPAEARAWYEAALAVPGPTPDVQRVLTLFMYAVSAVTILDSEFSETAVRKLMRAIAEVRLITRRRPDPRIHLFGCVATAIAGMFRQDRPSMMRALDEAQDDADPWNRAMAQMMRAMLAENAGEVDQMRADLTEALGGFRAIGDRWGMSLAQRGLASYALQAGEHEAARAALAESLRLLEELGTRDGVPMLLTQLAQSKAELGDVASARTDLERACELSARDGSPGGDSLSRAWLGVLERRDGNLAAARALTEDAIARLGDRLERTAPQGIAMLRALMSRVAVAEGNVADAGDLATRAVQAAVASDDMPILAMTVEAMAEVELRSGDPSRAAWLLGVAAALRGMRSIPASDVRRTVEALRDRLGDAYDTSYDEGAALTREQALAELGQPADASAGPVFRAEDRPGGVVVHRNRQVRRR
ncbi:MAG TPA: hypothetical protein VEK80_06810, partial [Kribbellaceae bacterium]|nr:hypothetical protein [Kribbellaceae bacterium]